MTILPARAGVILQRTIGASDDDNFTRTSGGDPTVFPTRTPTPVFYPHERG